MTKVSIKSRSSLYCLRVPRSREPVLYRGFQNVCPDSPRFKRNTSFPSSRQQRHQRRSEVVTTGVRHGIRGVPSTLRVKIDTTWSATQVGLRPVKSGLGGHDDGVWGVDDGVKNSSLPLRKRGRTAGSGCATFSGFTGVENDYVGEKRNGKHIRILRKSAVFVLHLIHLVSAPYKKDDHQMSQR